MGVPDRQPVARKPPGARSFIHDGTFSLDGGGALSGFELAYETWGELDPGKDNVVLLCTGLSASSHARSHQGDPAPGWWEEMIGPGLPIDTDRWFVICCNVIGGCFGSTGPSSSDPGTGLPFGIDFPQVSIWDMVRAQALLLDELGIGTLHAVVGASMGGMQAMAFGALFPRRGGRLVGISAPGRSYPLSISLRFVQRQAVMRDPAWRGGRYYPGPGPRSGLHLARQMGTITYRSGPEWDRRFARERRSSSSQEDPFAVEFEVESYLMHQSDQFVDRFDANSYLYLSKAMDQFDLGQGAPSYEDGLARITAPSLLIGVTTDLLFPIRQQEEVARVLREWGRDCRFVRLDSVYGHDAFLIEIERFGRILGGFLREYGDDPGSAPMGGMEAMTGG